MKIPISHRNRLSKLKYKLKQISQLKTKYKKIHKTKIKKQLLANNKQKMIKAIHKKLKPKIEESSTKKIFQLI